MRQNAWLVFAVVLLAIMACSSPNLQTNSGHRNYASNPPERMIVDSDGAIFWDDGAALAMLLRHPDQFEILGITTVLGNHWPYQAAEYLARILKTANRSDIPIYVGADKPLKNNRNQLNRLERDLIEKGLVAKTGFWKGAYSRPKEVKQLKDVEPVIGETLTGIVPRNEHAVDFIVETLSKNSDPITFVAIGPLTNLALALQKNPSIATKIRRLLIMGGNVQAEGNTTPYAELNFLFDPDAAQIVLSSSIQEKLLFPLDLSNQAILTKAHYEALVASDSPFASLLKMDRGPKFQDAKYTVQSWDTAVSAFLIDPNYIVASEILSLEIVHEYGPYYGSVRVSKEASSKVKVMKKMNFEMFFSILKNNI